MKHEPECPNYEGSCCPWMGDCNCQCICDVLKPAYERGKADALKELNQQS